MPALNSPTTSKRFNRGRMPAGVTLACGVMTVTLSPTITPSALASALPRMMPKPPGRRSSSVPCDHLATDIGHLLLFVRQDALDQGAANQRGMIQHRLAADVRRSALDPRILQRPAPALPANFPAARSSD